MKDYLTCKFAVYLGRWHLSTIVMSIVMCPLEMLTDFHWFWNLAIAQTVGAVIFFRIDLFIMVKFDDFVKNISKKR